MAAISAPTERASEATAFGPWNPGVKSRLPGRLLPLSTIFRPENVFADVARIRELSELTGLEFSELVTFRPQRLALHELLIRVTADLSVSDGSRYEDLGINFREIVSTIFTRYVLPDLPRIEDTYQRVRAQLAALIARELARFSAAEPDAAGARSGGTLRSLLGPRTRKPTRPTVGEDEAVSSFLTVADACEARADAGTDEAQVAALRSLARVIRSLYGKIGNWSTAAALIEPVALDLACNQLCGTYIGRLVDGHVAEAVRREGLRPLPPHDQALVMNTKGPSASGKSTLRPLQHALADRLGVDWSEFALVSPDIWRKQLLDYASLGPDYRYGAMLTGEELAIIDQKLDRHVERKAEKGRVSHLLIDRFRFGSFVFQSDRSGHRLLSRFGQQIYFFFMITPPEALVERAWKRGIEYGRYKAIDDLLAHSVEAYDGMPQLFLAWAGRTDKSVHFEFLDNSVPLGSAPRTVAFGWNSQLFVLDAKCLLDVVRYRRVNVDAESADQLFRDVGPASMAPQSNTEFLLQCVRELKEVVFADQASGRIYLRIEEGRPVWVDGPALIAAAQNAETGAALMAVAPGVIGRPAPAQPAPLYVADVLGADRIRTLGDWGREADRVRS